jgi:hypothetical protein
MLQFSGVYKLPPDIEPTEALSLLKERKVQFSSPFFHNLTGGIGVLLLDDKFGNDSSVFQPQIKTAKRLKKLHFEPNGLIGFVYNLLLEKIVKPSAKTEQVEQALREKMIPFNQALNVLK